MVQFYNPWGKHLRTLRVPGSGTISLRGIALALGMRFSCSEFAYLKSISHKVFNLFLYSLIVIICCRHFVSVMGGRFSASGARVGFLHLLRKHPTRLRSELSRVLFTWELPSACLFAHSLVYVARADFAV